MATELYIKDGTLLNCISDAKQVTLPAEIERVSAHAFDPCPDVQIINLYPGYVVQELMQYIVRLLRDVADGWDQDNYTPCLPVYNIDAAIIGQAIECAVEYYKEENPGITFNRITIDADRIEQMRQARAKGLDVASLHGLPVDSAGDTGFGVMYIKGIDSENYPALLKHNVDYNLIRSYSFLGYQLSDRWLVIIGSDVRLDTGDAVSTFGRSSCLMRNPKAYLEYMAGIGEVVD